jgi:hypothetical protein
MARGNVGLLQCRQDIACQASGWKGLGDVFSPVQQLVTQVTNHLAALTLIRHKAV